MTDTPSIADIRDLSEFDNHEFVMILTDEPTGLEAYVGIHNTNRGPALGGTRMTTYPSSEAALKDVLNLSKAMSYKCALANLPYGGGKGVIVAPPTLQVERDELLGAYARLVDKLGGLFKTGTDVGITEDDVRTMGAYTTHMLGLTEADRGNMTTGKTAALGVFHAMKAGLLVLDGSDDFHGKKVAIKGVGKLGSELARLVSEAGGAVRVSDVNPGACEQLMQQLPDVQVVDNATIIREEVDIYAPCALGNELTAESVPQLACRAVIGGANNQLAAPEVGDALAEKDILYAPDYIANAGGLIYVADELEPGGFNKERVLERTRGIEATMREIFEQAKREGIATHRVADAIGLERIQGGTHA